MTLGQDEINRHPLLAMIFTLQKAGHYSQASQILAEQDPYFYDQLEIKVLYGVLAQFPQVFINQKPALGYVQALFYRRMGQLRQATQLLVDTKATYAAAHQHRGVAHCTLELARLAQQQGDTHNAYHYLQLEVRPLLQEHLEQADRLQAHCALQLADSWLAQGDLAVARTHAKHALMLYTANDDSYGQLLAELWLAKHALATGNYAAVRSHLDKARQQMSSTPQGTLAEAALLHGELLLAWYQRSLDEAMKIAQNYLSVADMEPYSQNRIEARLLLGNLYRDLRQYRTAASWYAETATIIEQLGYPTYNPRLQTEMAWLHILEGQFSVARALLHAPEPCATAEMGSDQAPARPSSDSTPLPCLVETKWQMTQAVLHLLHGEWTEADALLSKVMVACEEQSDWLALCVARIYRGYRALHQKETHTLLQQLELAFRWLATQQITTFPHWWHPKILAEVCSHALICALYPTLVEQILVKHLGKASLPALKLLEKTDDIELRRLVSRLQQIIRGFSVNPLGEGRDSPGKQVIQELLTHGDLCAETYHELESELMTAPHRQHPNLTIVAVFGLYIQGQTRAEIATTLRCSLENVRNYITIIYQHFDLPAQHYQSREARKQKLIEKARGRGFIY